MTMQLVQHIELSSSAASITFSSIPQDGTDLLVKVSLRTNTIPSSGGVDIYLNFNGVTTGYSRRQLNGNGSSVSSSSGSDAIIGVANPSDSTTNTFSNGEIYVPNYTSSSNKSYSADNVTENNATGNFMSLHAALWSNTAAITSLSVFTSASFVAGSSATLYKVTKGSIPGITVS